VNIEQTSSRNDETQRVQITGDVDVGVVGYGYGRKRSWRPTRIAVTWERHRVDGGEWTGWCDEHLSWSGTTVRVDGSDGVARSERIWPWSELPADVSATVKAFVRGVTPGVDLPDPFRREVPVS
jgi:hypothetical protein